MYRYGGEDLEIRKRLAEAGHARLCDHPLANHPIVIRKVACFTFDRVDSALSLANHCVRWFESHWRSGEASVPKGDDSSATFTFNHDKEYGTPRRFATKQIGAASWMVADLDADGPAIWLHDVLVANGCTSIRWLSFDEWKAGAAGRALPY